MSPWPFRAKQSAGSAVQEPQHNADEVAVIYQAASLLLGYPDESLIERLDLIEQAVGQTSAAADFAPLIAKLRTDPGAARNDYVQEFDISKRHALHLTFWTDGDTRRRGEALAAVKQVYRDSGLLVDLHGELPDHLPLVLEFAAIGDPQRGRELLIKYRPSLEMLRLRLAEDGLPQNLVLAAICRTLPGKSPSSREEVQALFATAAPSESVGLAGYGDPAYAEIHADPTTYQMGYPDPAEWAITTDPYAALAGCGSQNFSSGQSGPTSLAMPTMPPPAAASRPESDGGTR